MVLWLCHQNFQKDSSKHEVSKQFKSVAYSKKLVTPLQKKGEKDGPMPSLPQNISVELHAIDVLHFNLVCSLCGSVYAATMQYAHSQRL